MADKEKIYKGIKACTNDHECLFCPYDSEYDYSSDCMEALIRDMAQLLNIQEESENGKNPCADCQEWDCYGCEYKDVKKE